MGAAQIVKHAGHDSLCDVLPWGDILLQCCANGGRTGDAAAQPWLSVLRCFARQGKRRDVCTLGVECAQVLHAKDVVRRTQDAFFDAKLLRQG